MSEELKPCPFCGCQATVITGAENVLITGSHSASCPFRDVDVIVDGREAWNSRAELAELEAGQGEAVAVVAYLPTEEDLGIKYSSKVGPVTWFGDPPRGEQLMTVTQHERIVAAITAQPASADAVSVPMELLERAMWPKDGSELIKANRELRALLASGDEK